MRMSCGIRAALSPLLVAAMLFAQQNPPRMFTAPPAPQQPEAKPAAPQPGQQPPGAAPAKPAAQPAQQPPPAAQPATTPAAGPPALTDSGGFLLDNVSLVELIDILARRMKINYILDPKVSGRVTIHTYDEVKPTELMPLMETILRVNGAAMLQVGDLSRIVPV